MLPAYLFRTGVLGRHRLIGAGGILAGNLVMNNSTVSGNSVTMTLASGSTSIGGGLFDFGGFEGSTITNSTFSGNTATVNNSVNASGVGGGMFEYRLGGHYYN